MHGYSLEAIIGLLCGPHVATAVSVGTIQLANKVL